MKSCVIISEYNPFHNGHMYQIDSAREILGADTCVIAIMSGNFVQRGDMALLDKYSRARAAIDCGADLVLELPLSACLSSAEGFARAAVNMVKAMNIDCFLCFGTECLDIGELLEIANILLDSKIDSQIVAELKAGITYAKARGNALGSINPRFADIISKPNNILAIEYLKQISGYDRIKPISIVRNGSEHDGSAVSGIFASASYIRKEVLLGNMAAVSRYMPPSSYKILSDLYNMGRVCGSLYNIEREVVSYLRRLTPDYLMNIDDTAEGLYNRVYRAFSGQNSLDGIYSAIKTKRYTMSRVRRIVLSSFLGVDRSLKRIEPGYIRVLGMSTVGIKFLGKIETDRFILTKQSAGKNFCGDDATLFDMDVLATDLYNLCYNGNIPWGHEYKGRPYIKNHFLE